VGTIWTLSADKKLKPVRVRVGLSDTQRTQVTPVGGATLAAGTDVVIGTSTPAAANAAASNPLTPTRQGGGPGGPGGRGP
jgi:hypothetical protein